LIRRNFKMGDKDTKDTYKANDSEVTETRDRNRVSIVEFIGLQ